MKDLYEQPSILPPMGLSDHSCVLWTPNDKPKVKPTKKRVLQLRETDTFDFGRWITQHQWSEVYDAVGVAEKADAFHATLESSIDTFFPTKTLKTYCTDKPWVTLRIKHLISLRQKTPRIKHLISLRQKAFHRNTPSVWKFYRNRIQRELANAMKSYYKDHVSTLKTCNPRRWHQEIMTMLNTTKQASAIVIPGSETADNITVANTINAKFAAVSQALPAMDTSELPSFLPASQELPTRHVWDVCKRLLAVNTNKAPGPDGIPFKVLREFACDLSTPLYHVLNSSYAKGTVPSQWKQAVVVPVSKSQPASLDQLRLISFTSQFAKIAEFFVTRWIHNDDKFDQRQ
ncbi:uncharacterized protein LOC144884690 [Branchiostoma floridae x Branchiostoma japonicum]